MTHPHVLPPVSPIWVPYCTACGVSFLGLISYIRSVAVKGARDAFCGRCGQGPAVKVAKFRFVRRVQK